MSTASLPFTARERGLPPRFLLTGTVVGVLDMSAAIILYALVRHLTTPQRVMQSVAAGVLGKASYDGGAGTAALGLALHFTIAFIWTTLYYVVIRRWGALARAASTARGAILVGLAVGTVICFAMYEIVLPLSRAAASPPVLSSRFLTQLVIHWVCIGIPMVLVARDGRKR